MINYEVNLEVENTIDQIFSEWLAEHIQEILRFNGFKNARVFEDTSYDSDLYHKITINYELDNIENLQDYFNNHATRMREKTKELFGDKVKASRRVLKLTHAFSENLI